ncbi:transporter substrate-binding domain-containing protein [Paenibacillus motobuensis]|uniref:transporter substrate-binding domain-containing protein n=1 Tax=Paenibacillus TaxID=44249 RepID=UPI00203CBDD5|nr:MULTISPECIES: transporter substrate-binding domain-containing protein [Paenibacillus]MCM3039268.1 transporter substrate-binding domain-containing protein [Paenibacillus lutimineralis]MCM3646372.1 transporter substrate-binding domain-containing protein [Paenibacillus motobuensis]
MKKWGTLVIALLMVTSLLAACGQNKNNDGSAQGAGSNAGNASKKVITLGTSADFAPYEFHIKNDQGQDEIVGFDIEIAKEIAKDLGAELQIKDLQFDSLMNELNSGRIDLAISGLSPTADRQKEVDMSKIYFTATQAVVTRAGEEGSYKTLDTLVGKKIGVQKGSIQEGIAQTIKDAKITSLAKTQDIMMQLKTGRIDVAIIEGPVAEAYVSNIDGLTIAEAQPKAEDDGYIVAVKKGNKELLDKVNATLTRLMEDGSIDKFIVEASELAEK